MLKITYTLVVCKASIATLSRSGFMFKEKWMTQKNDLNKEFIYEIKLEKAHKEKERRKK